MRLQVWPTPPVAALAVSMVARPVVGLAATPEQAKAFSERAAAHILEVGARMDQKSVFA